MITNISITGYNDVEKRSDGIWKYVTATVETNDNSSPDTDDNLATIVLRIDKLVTVIRNFGEPSSWMCVMAIHVDDIPLLKVIYG